jgi:hypothetical protein
MINTSRRLATVLVAGLALLTLAGCGSGATGAGGDPSAPSGGASTRAGGRGGQGGVPGVLGLIVAQSGKTIQVRTSSGQSTVSYTSKTTVTEERSAKAADAKVGTCAVVRSADTGSAGSSTGSAITASSISLSDAVGGSCRGGFGGGNRPSGMPTGGFDGQGVRPSGTLEDGGAPSGQPSGAMPGAVRGGGFGGASGTITAVDGSSLTIEQTRGSRTTSLAVTLTGATTFSKQSKTDTDAIRKGKCVFASGKRDSTGALAATAVRLTPAVDGECSFGGRGQRANGTQSGG